MGCAEEWLGLKGPAQVNMFRCVKKTCFYTQGSNINDRNSFSNCRRSYLLERYTKNPPR
jgi:hypothetical protein